MPGLLGDRETLPPRVPHADREAGRRRRASGCWPAASGRSCCAGPRSRWPPSCRPRPRSCSRDRAHRGQRDLYETVRLVDARAGPRRRSQPGASRAATSSILDALLKLRQVCCDPRLVKLAAARQRRRQRQVRAAHGHAAAADRGRAGASSLFSQFTEHARPDRAGARPGRHPVRRAAPARPRTAQTPVARFQAGEVPLFLISLKAGGTGLNLTARRHRDPLRPVVEPGGRGPGDRPRPPHRPGQDRCSSTS